MIDTRHLVYFVALADTLHFGRAAARVHISQPPFSRQIAALERELGVLLVERGTRAVRLTKAGERLHADATALLAGLDRAREAVVATARGLAGKLMIGFSMYAAYNVLPALARDCARDHPDIETHLREHFPAPLVAALQDEEIDVALMLAAAAAGRFETLPLLRDPVMAALPGDHPLAGAASLDVAALAQESFILAPREGAGAFHDMVLGLCRDAGFAPRVRLEPYLQQTVVNLVAEGLGVALVPGSFRKMRLSNVAFVPLVHAPVVELVLAWHPHTRNPCVGSFIEVARRHAAGARQGAVEDRASTLD